MSGLFFSKTLSQIFSKTGCKIQNHCRTLQRSFKYCFVITKG